MSTPARKANRARATPDTGVVLGRYRIDGSLGEGGMASVLRVWDLAANRALALKRLAKNASGKHVALFEREYYTLASLRHPSLVEVHDYATDEDGPLYTMELLRERLLRPRAHAVRSMRAASCATSHRRSRSSTPEGSFTATSARGTCGACPTAASSSSTSAPWRPSARRATSPAPPRSWPPSLCTGRYPISVPISTRWGPSATSFYRDARFPGARARFARCPLARGSPPAVSSGLRASPGRLARGAARPRTRRSRRSSAGIPWRAPPAPPR